VPVGRQRRVKAVERITTTIERRWLAAIIAGEKTVEYREMKPYWPDLTVPRGSKESVLRALEKILQAP